MKCLKLSTLFLIFIFLSNCSTPYQPKGALGGYSQEKILDSVYRVKFEGNQHLKPQKVQNYLMYRCAELTQEIGYEYFAIITDERHFDELSVRPSRSAYSSGSTTSLSGGTRNAVSPDLQTAASSTKYTGVYVIKFLETIDEKYINTIFHVPAVLDKLSEIVKK
jgi:hypothetical protein